MTKVTALAHEFVELIPDDLREGMLYVSMGFATVAHKCCCGCGNEVVTPLSPTDWKLIFDGETISLCPSIGNWSFACRSHYWIKNNKVQWADEWSSEKIEAARTHDRRAKTIYYSGADTAADHVVRNNPEAENGFWKKLRKWRQRLLNRTGENP